MRIALTALCLLVVVSACGAAVETPLYSPVEVKATVAPYAVKPDLSNVSNLKQFGEFTPEQNGLLAKNGRTASRLT